MWKEFDKAVYKMFQFVNGKKTVLWGYGQSGYFIEHLFRQCNKKIDYIIDDSPTIHVKLPVSRSVEIKYMDRDTHAVLLAFSRDRKVDEYLEKLGYQEKINYVYLKDLFYTGNCELKIKLSYYDWLEYTYGLDIAQYKMYDTLERVNNDSTYYSPGIDYALADVVSDFYFDKTADSVFDFGCGKGGALLLFGRGGMEKLGGVEYDEELYSTACSNFKKVGLKTDFLIRGDATILKRELDEFNYFYMYHPFSGDTFKKVIFNLEESFSRRKRRITLIYANPFCHDDVVRNDIFKLSKQIIADYSIKKVNVCTITES